MTFAQAGLEALVQSIDPAANIADEMMGDVTHVITASDDAGRCKRTVKYLVGILRGLWIVSYSCKRKRDISYFVFVFLLLVSLTISRWFSPQG